MSVDYTALVLDIHYRTSTQSDKRATHVHMTLSCNEQVSDCRDVISDDQGCFVLARVREGEVDSIEKLHFHRHAHHEHDLRYNIQEKRSF